MILCLVCLQGSSPARRRGVPGHPAGHHLPRPEPRPLPRHRGLPLLLAASERIDFLPPTGILVIEFLPRSFQLRALFFCFRTFRLKDFHASSILLPI